MHHEDGKLLDTCNGDEYTTFEDVMHYLKDDVDYECLNVYHSILPDLLKTAFKGKVKKETNIRIIAEAMEQSTIYKDMLSKVDKILQIFLTFPVTSATAEGPFSSL